MIKEFLSFAEVEERAKALASSKGDLSSFEDYRAGEGWADWMEDFTSAGDGEECTEREIANIEKAQMEIWHRAIKIRAERMKECCQSLGRVTAIIEKRTDMPHRVVAKIASQPLNLITWFRKVKSQDDEELVEVMNNIDDIPASLTVAAQGDFWIGYYSQNDICSFRERIGSQLKAARLSKEMSMKDVADKAGLTEATISKIENGKWSVSLDLLEKVCAVLDVKLGLTE